MNSNQLKTMTLAIAMLALLTGIKSAAADTISQGFESASGSTPPAGWSFVDTGTSGVYTTPTGNGGGQGGGVDWTGAASAAPMAYIVHDGYGFYLTQPISGSFDFYVTEDGNYSSGNFFFGEIQDGLDNAAGEYLNVHLREKTFGARAQLLDGDGTALVSDSNNLREIFTDQWHTANFTWTPTSGTTGNFAMTWGTASQTESMSYNGYTFAATEGFFGFGSGRSPVIFDNIEITGMLVPEPTSILLGLIGLLGVAALLWRRQRRR